MTQSADKPKEQTMSAMSETIQSKRADVMRRVQKLLAIANDTRGDANECAAAASQAERIMRKFGIEHAEILEREIRDGQAEPLGTVDIGGNLEPERAGRTVSKYSSILSIQIAALNDCIAKRERRNGREVIVYQGFRSDVELCRYMHVYIIGQLRVASESYAKEFSSRRSDLAEFRFAFASAVCRSLRAARKERDAEMAAASTSRSLVITKRGAVVAQFGQQKQRSVGSRVVTSASEAGYEAGYRVDVNRRGIAGTQAARAAITN
jgi:hypothetical protein